MKIVCPTERTALYHRYQGQTNRQPVIIQIDPIQDTLSIDYNAEIGNAVPTAVYHGRIRRFTLAQVPTADAARELLEQIYSLAMEVSAGYSEEWDGSNMIGKLTPHAEAVEQAIERELTTWAEHAAPAETVCGWAASEWYTSGDAATELGITAVTTDEQVEASLQEHEGIVDGPDGEVIVLEGVREFMRQVRDGLREQTPILETRIPEGAPVPGLEYGAHYSEPARGWTGYHVRGDCTGGRWVICRQTPASDELEDDIIEAIREECRGL